MHEALEVVVVCKHENFIFTALLIVPPSLEHFNNGQQLPVVGLIPSLSRNYLSSSFKSICHLLRLDQHNTSGLRRN